jgi:hypothetical protein
LEIEVLYPNVGSNPLHGFKFIFLGNPVCVAEQGFAWKKRGRDEIAIHAKTDLCGLRAELG